MVIKIFLLIALFGFNLVQAHSYERIAIISDAILAPALPYNSYYKTPEFFLIDVADMIEKEQKFEAISLVEVKKALQSGNFSKSDLNTLSGLQQGYNIDFAFLKKLSRAVGTNHIVIVTSGMEIQRDFLKNTLWNVIGVPGWDVINPTQRLNVYAAYVDTSKERVLWECIFEKDIRNNKFKNLDHTISNNYEGIMRLKEYSKYISPVIAYNVKVRVNDPYYVAPPKTLNVSNISKGIKRKKRIGIQKEITAVNAKKWKAPLIRGRKNNVENL